MSQSFLKIFWGQARQAGGAVLEVVAVTGYFASAMHCVREYLVDVTLCTGPSMLPALGVEGNIVAIEAVTPRFSKVKLGDVVIANSPNNPTITVCKRVCGLEGDIVEIPPAHSFQSVRHQLVPQGHVWLQGDNLLNSTDSRSYGPVPLGLIRGRVFCKVWPLSEAKLFGTEPQLCGTCIHRPGAGGANVAIGDIATTATATTTAGCGETEIRDGASSEKEAV